MFRFLQPRRTGDQRIDTVGTAGIESQTTSAPDNAQVTDPIAAASPPPPRPSRARGALFEIVETIVLTVVIFLGIQTFVAQPFQVEQSSMEQSLLPGQYVLIDKLTPRFSPYQPGDIVVFNPPESGGRGTVPLIKRVVAVGGDRVELRDGAVYVNDRKLAEPYLFNEGGVAQPTDPSAGISSWEVPAGQLFVMGDHRAVSQDSRVFGPIPVSSVLGRAFVRYWPLEDFEIIHRP